MEFDSQKQRHIINAFFHCFDILAYAIELVVNGLPVIKS